MMRGEGNMAKTEYIVKRINFRKDALDKLYDAFIALAEGGVQSYVIDDRELTKFDLDALADEIRKLENEIDALEAELDGRKGRKAVAVVPRDI